LSEGWDGDKGVTLWAATMSGNGIRIVLLHNGRAHFQKTKNLKIKSGKSVGKSVLVLDYA